MTETPVFEVIFKVSESRQCELARTLNSNIGVFRHCEAC